MRKLIIFTITCCCFGLTACNDFLKEEPKSSLSKDMFFENANDAYASVNILYTGGMMGHLRGINFMGCTYFFPMAYRAGGLIDNVRGRDNNVEVLWAVTMTMNRGIDKGDRTPLGLWSAPYQTIARNCNWALEKLPDCPGLTDAQRTQLIAEAHFFRALNYYYLVSIFGPVPIVLNSFASLDDGIYNKRSSEKLVYEQILKDLNVAIEANLPDLPMPANGFRVSRGSVLALAADVCLNMAGYPIYDASKYALAAEYAKRLISSSNYALIQHGASFDKSNPSTWSSSAYSTMRTSETQREYLFVREYNASIYPANYQPSWCLPWEATAYAGLGRYGSYTEAYMPDETLLALYDEDNDLRFQERQYFHRSYTDSRGVKWEFTRPYPFFWWEEAALTQTGLGEKNRDVYRLAEMYLTAAEALVEAGGTVTDEAAGYLATIQARASLNKDFETIKTELMTLSKENFIDEVLKERIRELLFEAKIWRDCFRTQKYPKYDYATGNVSFIPLIGASPVSNPEIRFQESDLYWYIPNLVCQRNPQLLEEPLK